jgi:hypothetical protein
VLDGKKVRLGFEGEKLDPFGDEQDYPEQGEVLRNLSKVLDDKEVEAIFEFNLTTVQKLDQILTSEDPLFFELCKGLKFEASVKFHNKQFRRVL